jgi:hypothetical protein
MRNLNLVEVNISEVFLAHIKRDDTSIHQRVAIGFNSNNLNKEFVILESTKDELSW